MSEKSALIAELNDQFRRSLGTSTILGTVVVTAGFMTLDMAQRNQVVQAVIDFNRFTKENDPYGEHDFGAIRLPGIEKIFWKINYYDPSLQYGSENPADPAQTHRVLTIMLASEY